MAHDDVCPCKHGTRICERSCEDCLIAMYGWEAAQWLMSGDPGPHYPGPHVEREF